MTASGTVIASIPAGAADDGVGNGNVASTSTDNTVTWDVVAPTVTINQGETRPTRPTRRRSSSRWHSANVDGFTAGDVTFAGSTAGGTLVGTVTGSGASYKVQSRG